jgi:hypothetical protein
LFCRGFICVCFIFSSLTLFAAYKPSLRGFRHKDNNHKVIWVMCSPNSWSFIVFALSFPVPSFPRSYNPHSISTNSTGRSKR